ncbi:unnamed protein product [Ranitomeya imitator]|uniref:GFO/IDH/MocA-like oxidoreductase domain-containing protein n=1 Tax=Ranitomeya imitator TaxID=111125 RepID=A0ABN9MLD7_9NEOB|nr:unnamed protein product [Ranitomeya imitator]
MTSSSSLHAAAPAQAYFVFPVEGRAKYCSAQVPGLSDLSRCLRTAVLCSALNREDKVRLRRVKTRRGPHPMKMGGPGPDRNSHRTRTGPGPPLGIGKNVICDRTATPLDAFRMMSAAHYYPKLMSIMGNVLRFLPAFGKMKQLIQEGYVGELQVCEVQVHSGSLLGKKYNWSCDDLMGGGGLHSVGSYIIDLLTFLTNQKAVKVHGLLKTFVKQTDHIQGIRQITSDDFCTFQMVLEGEVCCTVTLNFNVPGEFKQDVIVVGSFGRLIVKGTDLFGQQNNCDEQQLLLKDSTPVSNSLLPEKAFSDIPSPYLIGTIKMIQAVRHAFHDQEDRRTWDGRPLTMAATFDDCLYALCVVDTIKKI